MTIDPDKLKLFSFQLFSKLEGAVTAGMVHIGDQLGLYEAMRSAGAPLTTTELAERCRICTSGGSANGRTTRPRPSSSRSTIDERFSLSPEGEAVLATPDHPAFGDGDVPSTAGADGGARSGQRKLPHRPRPRLRQPRSRRCRRHRARLRAVEQRLPAANCVAGARRCRRSTDRGSERRRRWLRRGIRSVVDGRCISGIDLRRLRHLSLRPRSGQREAGGCRA